MKVEVGKFYKSTCGKKGWCYNYIKSHDYYQVAWSGKDVSQWYYEDGRERCGLSNPIEIESEWPEKPESYEYDGVKADLESLLAKIKPLADFYNANYNREPKAKAGGVKTRPILFSGEMVRALLEGRKTQTRRIVKPQPPHKLREASEGYLHLIIDLVEGTEKITHFPTDCPYGNAGDLLWVRETFGDRAWYAEINKHRNDRYYFAADGKRNEWSYKPSIHMPRAASRLTLEITGVRVERLQEISEADAKAEGCFFSDYGRECFHQNKPPCDIGDCLAPEITHPQRKGWMWDKTTSHEQCLGSARSAYGNLWNSINGAESWNANPWVWVIEFKVHQCNVDEFIKAKAGA